MFPVSRQPGQRTPPAGRVWLVKPKAYVSMNGLTCWGSTVDRLLGFHKFSEKY